jgi:hypothetical protein
MPCECDPKDGPFACRSEVSRLVESKDREEGRQRCAQGFASKDEHRGAHPQCCTSRLQDNNKTCLYSVPVARGRRSTDAVCSQNWRTARGEPQEAKQVYSGRHPVPFETKHRTGRREQFISRMTQTDSKMLKEMHLKRRATEFDKLQV